MTRFAFDIIGFDLDGTLLDTSGDLADAVNHAIGTIGLAPFSPHEIRPFVGRGAKVMLERALKVSDHEDAALTDQLLPVLLDHYADNLSRHTAPYPGILSAMDRLRESGMRLAICTNKRERFTLPLIDQLGLSHYFSAIIGGDTVGVMKPDPEPVHAMIERAGGGRCLFIGDTTNDTRAARAAGVSSVAVSFGFCDSPAHELGADAVIDHFDELVPLIENWPG